MKILIPVLALLLFPNVIFSQQVQKSEAIEVGESF